MFYISSKKGIKYGVTDTSDMVEEYYTEPQILKFIQSSVKIHGVIIGHTRQINFSVIPKDKVRYLEMSTEQLIRMYLKPALTKCNVELPYSSDIRVRENEFESRFLGGISAWHSVDDEDICDADRLDRRVSERISKACKEFKKITGIEAYWSNHQEKGWSSIYFTRL